MTNIYRAASSILIGLGLSVNALASVCTDGELSKRNLLVECKANDLVDTRNGSLYSEVKFCISREWRDGGPFGGEKIPWYFTHIEVIDDAGGVQSYTFDNPDGRHNFRSLLDYTELFHDGGDFALLSNRTVYPAPMKPGKIHTHNVEFNFGSGRLFVNYDRSERVNFGKVTEIIEIQGTCR
jgi:hypothetical protein